MRDVVVSNLRSGYLYPDEIPKYELLVGRTVVIVDFLSDFLNFCVVADEFECEPKSFYQAGTVVANELMFRCI